MFDGTNANQRNLTVDYIKNKDIKKKIIYLLLISTMILLVQLTLAVEIQAHMKSGHPSTQFRVQSLRFLQMTLI